MRYLTLLIAALLVCNTINAQLNNGLLAHWNFNNNTNDQSGNGYNGQPFNVTYTKGMHGLDSTAASFNGSSSYISVPYKAGMNLNQFTITAIVKANGYYQGDCQGNYILGRGNDHYSGHYSLFFSDNAFDTVNCKKLDTGKHIFYSGISTKSSKVSSLKWQYTPTIKSGQWYCVVSVFDSFKNDIYVNGTLMVSVPIPTGPIGASTKGITIGASENGPTYPYWLNGDIDDLRLYNRAFSAAEASSLCSLYDTLVYITQQPAQNQFCGGDTLDISYDLLGSFASVNTLTAELSDTAGNFTNSTTIGLVNSNAAGTIKCVLPANITPGQNYRIRIASSAPGKISEPGQAFVAYPVLSPSVSITASPTGPYKDDEYIFFNATTTHAGAAATYQWYRNNIPINGATKDSLNIHTLNDGDSIYVVVSSTNPCTPTVSDTSNKIAVRILTSIDNINLHNLTLYPNPGKGDMVLSADNVQYEQVNVTVFNTVGQMVYKQDAGVRNGILNHNIQLTEQPAGLYLVRLSADGLDRSIRCVIQQ